MSSFWDRLQIAFKNAKAPQIAEKLHISKQAVYRWRDGEMPKRTHLEKISELTGTSLYWLMNGIEIEQLKKDAIQPVVEPSEKASQSSRSALVIEDEFEAEMAVMFFNYKNLSRKQKEDMRHIIANVDREIKRRKEANEASSLTANEARMEQAGVDK